MLDTPDSVDEDAIKKARSGVCFRMHRLRLVSVSKTCGIIIAMAVVIFVTVIWVTLTLSSRPPKRQSSNHVVTTIRTTITPAIVAEPMSIGRVHLSADAKRIQLANEGYMYAHICKELMLPIRTIAGGSAARVINLLNNATVNDTVSLGTYHYYTVCVEMHEHHHIVDVYLELPHSPKGIGADGQRSDADMYLSTHISEPKLYDSTWLSAKRGSDHIRLSTNLRDWVQTSKTLHIGVYGRSAHPVDYSIRVVVRASKTKRHKGGQTADNLKGPNTLLSRTLRFRGRTDEP